MTTLYINFISASIPGHWLADEDELHVELKKIMPDVKKYSSKGFTNYKGYKIEEIFRCYNSETPCSGVNVIELKVIPKNL